MNGSERPGGDWRTVAGQVRRALETRGPEWGTRRILELPLPEFETVVFGITGTPLDSRSFEIVGAGSEGERGDLECPGLAQAAAYPIELVVRNDEGTVRVQMVDAMFRMKMYFEDAGKWAFMKNMGMPGSIADEIKGQFRPVFPDSLRAD